MPLAEIRHRVVVMSGVLLAASLIVYLAVHGSAYYRLPLDQRPFSPLHSQLRSSGTIGLKLGILGACMFCFLALYPLRKRWQWLSRIGVTRRWLNVHILFGVSTPLIVTFHTSFRWHGVAGLAYWTMISVALSGFIGRYVYAKIPRSLNSAQLTADELQARNDQLARELAAQKFFTEADFAPLFALPPVQEIRSAGFLQALFILIASDLRRPLHIGRLRRRTLRPAQRLTTLGGLLPSSDARLETIIRNVRQQSRLRFMTAFLHRTERIFHWWHVIHRPFSISFAALILIHISVALSVGFN